jgi:5-methyltetrahydropteroyltriglutamate--homocysteine methyltransferase
MFTATKGKALLTTTTGALPRPSWYSANLRGMPLSHGLSQAAYREQHFDCLACNVAAQHRAGIDIFVDGDARLDDDVAGRSWVSYATERIDGIGKPLVEVPPAHFMADKGPGDLMWEVIETRMTPPVVGPIGATALELDRAYKAIAPMTDRPVKIGSISAQILALMLADEHYRDRLKLLFDLSAALNREYHALADAGAPIVQIEEPAIHQVIADPRATIAPAQWVEAFNAEVAGLRSKCEVWCHTCWGSPAAQRVASREQSYKDALPYLDQLDVDVISVQPRLGLRTHRQNDIQGQEGGARRDQSPHAASRAPRGGSRAHPARAPVHRAGAVDLIERLRLRPAVDEPHARLLQNGRAGARRQHRAPRTRIGASLCTRSRSATIDGTDGQEHRAWMTAPHL